MYDRRRRPLLFIHRLVTFCAVIRASLLLAFVVLTVRARGQSVMDSSRDTRLAGSYAPLDTTDDFTHVHTITVIIGQVHEPHGKDVRAYCTVPGGAIPFLALGKETTPALVSQYAIDVGYSGTRSINQGGSPLQLLADSARIALPLRGEPTHETGPGSVAENAVYRVTTRDLHRLAAAHDIKGRISGTGGSCTFSFSDATAATLRQFVAHEVPGN